MQSQCIEDSSLNNMVNAIQYVQEVLEGEVFVLIDEYDRFANKIMFENPDQYNKVVVVRSVDLLSSPIRSFFETIKTMTNIRSFTVGISPIALADASGANFVYDISEYHHQCWGHSRTHRRRCSFCSDVHLRE